MFRLSKATTRGVATGSKPSVATPIAVSSSWKFVNPLGNNRGGLQVRIPGGGKVGLALILAQGRVAQVVDAGLTITRTKLPGYSSSTISILGLSPFSTVFVNGVVLNSEYRSGMMDFSLAYGSPAGAGSYLVTSIICCPGIAPSLFS